MRVAIDISQVIYGTGVSTYTKNLLLNLLKLDSTNEYMLFGGSLRRRSELEAWADSFKGNVRSKIFPIPPAVADIVGNLIHFPKIEKILGPLDVYHSSDWVQYPSGAFKVTTVHDLAPIIFRKFTNEKIVEVHKRRLKWVLGEADRIIVPSEATKLDILNLGANGAAVRVIPEAPGSSFKPASSQEIERVKTKYKIFGPYVVGIGINPRKNTQRIIEAFSKAKEKELKLVLVGRRNMRLEETRGVIFANYAPDIDLAALYSGAEALIYTSLYEGFGLPIFEAFACGCPVVTSNISSMPEVAGGAAILVDPYDVDSISEGIKKALRSKIGLKARGLKQVAKFSWDETAKMTLEVYKERN